MGNKDIIAKGLLIPLFIGIILLTFTTSTGVLCTSIDSTDLSLRDGCDDNSSPSGYWIGAPTFCKDSQNPNYCQNVTNVRLALFISGLILMCCGCSLVSCNVCCILLSRKKKEQALLLPRRVNS